MYSAFKHFSPDKTLMRLKRVIIYLSGCIFCFQNNFTNNTSENAPLTNFLSRVKIADLFPLPGNPLADFRLHDMYVMTYP